MEHQTGTRWLTAFLMGILLVACLNAASGTKHQLSGLTPDDENAIRATIEAYRTAWLENDSKGVLRTFTDDGVLLPAHGSQAVVGIAAIEEYWFTPGGPPTTITELKITVDQLGGSRDLGFARGLDNVAWTIVQEGKTQRHSHPGTYLNVMKKLPDGSWRIQVHMWDDGPERVE